MEESMKNQDVTNERRGLFLFLYLCCVDGGWYHLFGDDPFSVMMFWVKFSP